VADRGPFSPACEKLTQVSDGMIGAIDKIIGFYQIQASAMHILVANTQKALEQFAPEEEKIANEQTRRLDNFVKDLTRDLSDMLTRFWFLKERMQRKNQSMTNDQIKNLADFANFTKTLVKDVRLLLNRFEKTGSQTFEKKFDKEVKQMEAYVKNRLKGFDNALEQTLTDTPKTWKEQLRRYVGKGA